MAVSPQELQFILRMQDSMTQELAPVIAQLQRVATAAEGAHTSLQHMAAGGGGGLGAVSSGASTAAANLTQLKTVALEVGAAFVAMKAGAGVIESVMGSFMKFESLSADVEKYTTMGANDLKVFAAGFKELAAGMPVPIEGLSKIVNLAAQIGVQGPENILKFAQAASKLAAVSNLTPEQSLMTIRQIMQLTATADDQVENVVSAFAKLDNVTASLASNIGNLSVRVGQATSTFGVSVSFVQAVSAAMANFGVRAEQGGTAVGLVFLKLQKLMQGDMPKAVKDMEATMHMSLAQMKADFSASPETFFLKFIQAMHNLGDESNKMLNELQLGQSRTGQSVAVLIKHPQTLMEDMKLALSAATDATKRINFEFETQVKTMQNQLIILGNRWEVLKTTLAEPLAGAATNGIKSLETILTSLTKAFESLSPHMKAVVSDLLVLGPAVGGVGIAFGALFGALALLSPEVLLVLGGIGLLSGALVYFNETAAAAPPLAKQEADALDQLAASSDNAAQMLSTLTEAQKAQLQITYREKLDADQRALEDATTQIKKLTDATTDHIIAVSEDGVVISSAIQPTDALQEALKEAATRFVEGKETAESLNSTVVNLINTFPGASHESLVMADNLKKLSSSANTAYGEISKLVQGLAALAGIGVGTPKGHDLGHGQYNMPPASAMGTPEGPHISGGGGKKGGGGKEESLRSFLEETNQKIEAMKKETVAAGTSYDEFTKMQSAMKDDQDILKLEDRARKLGMTAEAAKALAAEYGAALKAEHASVDAAKVVDEVRTINDKITAMKQETEAANEGQIAYARYKATKKEEADLTAFVKKLEALHAEKSTIDQLTAAYKQAEVASRQAVEAMGTTFEGGVRDGWQAIVKDVNNTGETIKSAMTDAFSKANDAMTKFITTGKLNFKDLVTAVTQDMAKLAEKMLIEQPILAMLGMGGTGNVWSQMFGGSGGTTTTGKSTEGSTSGGGSGGLMSGASGMLGGLLSNIGKIGDLFKGGGAAAASGLSAAAIAGAASDATEIGTATAALFPFHTGGVVGGPNPPIPRSFPTRVLDNAPRFHSGMASDEYAAVLQRGERVLTAQQDKVIGGIIRGGANDNGGHQTVVHNWNITTPDVSGFARSQGQVQAMVARSMGTTTSRLRK